MGEIQLNFAYPVPPERVWRAITDSVQLAVWLMDNDFAPSVGHRFMLWPGTLRGFDGPVSAVVLKLDAPARNTPGRLVMGWQSGQMHALVTWLVEPTRGGARLRVTQSGMFGIDEGITKDLVESYRLAFGERLRSLLVGPAEEAVTPVAPAPDPARDLRWRPRLPMPMALRGPWRLMAAVAVLFVFAGAVGTAAWVLLPERVPPPADGAMGSGPGDSGGVGNSLGGSPSGTAGAAGAANGPSAGPIPPGSTFPAVPVPSSSGQPPAGSLTATFTVSEGPVTTTVNVVIANGGGSTVAGWTVAFEFGGVNLSVLSDTKQVIQDIKGGRHIFTPTDETLIVPAGRSVRFALVITGLLDGVQICTIDGRPCIAG